MNKIRHYKNAKTIATLLDAQFGIGNFRFGLDFLVGLIPGIGDYITLSLSLYIISIALSYNVSKFDLARMIFNVAVDFLIGIVPFLGDFFDVLYKGNLRNLRILEKYALPESA